MKDNVKRSIENAVNKASSAMLAIVRVFEEHGKDISADYSGKAFAHLARSFNTARERAEAARLVKAPPLGVFSLDDETPLTSQAKPTISPMLLEPTAETERLIIAPRTTTLIKPKWVKPEGRLAGSKEPVYATGEQPKAIDELSAVPDKTGFVKDAGFLDK